ncbi:hypothetical protein O0I10_008270 [Lichtheimia ornata]|uniref:Uncharacterized protein n=1 Tax=Lichtheimia ornata TaxID=688661 RepID=A0AAD7XX03_9FUNG|nr:uncharacterized protein O0I10_008270 [Lichtheimia ornata]KAJ8656048.1 hypothetical protein O0I10_008270 [Lichtheimia ornata]
MAFRDKCCFCISLKTGTLLLAILGTISHFYGAITLTALSDELKNVDGGTVFGLTMYSYLSGFACLAGAIGVVKHNAKHLRLFSSFYWIDLALHMLFSVASAYLLFSMHTEICEQVVREAPNDEPMDMESCESVYSASAWLVTLAMAINMLIKLHFAFAIHRYTNVVKREQEQEENWDAHVVVAAPPPVYEPSDKKEFIFVAGKEYIPDEKQTPANNNNQS